MIVGPNGGIDLMTGGGTKVAVSMASALADANWDVTMIAAWTYDVSTLANIHAEFLDPRRIKVRRILPFRALGLPVPRPFWIAHISTIIRKTIKRLNPDLLIFHDDVLKNAIDGYAGNTILYAHFPETVVARGILSGSYVRDSCSKLHRVYNVLNRRLLTISDGPDLVIANSTVTQRYMSPLVKHVPCIIIHPPATVQPKVSEFGLSRRNNVVHSCQVKNTAQLLELARALQGMKPLVTAEVFRFNPKLRKRLENQFRKFGISSEIFRFRRFEEFVQLRTALESSKFFVNPRRFEPFGIGTVDAMAVGAVPIAYASVDNGSAVDILENGRFGHIYHDIEELREQIAALVSDEEEFKEWSSLAIKRAQDFTDFQFKGKFIEAIHRYACE